jgi:NADPH-dependent 2,4-dienoyl-CoA reductase/sulfur reductase-like enzyme
MDRRKFLGTLAAAAIPAFPSAPSVRAAARSRGVVVAGGGVGGAAFCLALKRLAPQAEITLVEPHPRLLFAPAAFDYIFGHATLQAITRGYEPLTRRGIRHLRAEVTAVDTRARRVRTSAGALDYGQLVIASGIRRATEEIAGLAQAPEANLDLYQRAHLPLLRERIAALESGTVIIGIPPPPHSCPPAAYEFALLLAERIRARRLKARVLVLDANPQPQPSPLAPGLDAAIRGSSGVIEYIPSIRVARLEPQARRVVSADGEPFSYDLLCLIAPHKAARFVSDAGLGEGGDPFVQVDAASFRSRRDEAIYSFGDAARTPYARAAQSAYEAARRCARVVARVLGAAAPDPGPLGFEAPCYPYVSAEQALSLRVAYRAEHEALDVKITADTSPARHHAATRRAWQQRLVQDILDA